MPNPFRSPKQRSDYDVVVESYRNRHCSLFLPQNGAENRLNAIGANFWKGFHEQGVSSWSRAGRQTSAYTIFRAGLDMGKEARAQRAAADQNDLP